MGNVQMEARQIRYGSTNVEEAIKNAGGSSELTARVDALEASVGDLETEVSVLDANFYSETETKIGKWNGHDLYRKCIFGVSLPNNTTALYGDALTGVTIRNMYGTVYDTGYTMPLPFVGSSTNMIEFYFDKTAGKPTITTHFDRSSQTCDIVIEYTKNVAPENNSR